MLHPENTSLEGLQDFAYSNGLYLQTHTPETARHKGLYFPDYRIISLRDDLHPIEQRCTLAHELGHFIHGHLGCLPGKSERQARFWAANTLISLEEYQDAENINPAPAAIAYMLQVTIETVTDWQQLHQRTSSRRGRLGPVLSHHRAYGSVHGGSFRQHAHADKQPQKKENPSSKAAD